MYGRGGKAGRWEEGKYRRGSLPEEQSELERPADRLTEASTPRSASESSISRSLKAKRK